MSDCVLLLVLVCFTCVIITPTRVSSQAYQSYPTYEAYPTKQTYPTYQTYGETSPGATGKKYYLETSYKANWHAAYVACVKNNSRLATIESVQENSRVVNMIENSGRNGHSFWLGGSDLAEEGRWTWLLFGRPIGRTNFWHAGEPGNFNDDEHCLDYFFFNEEYKWNDAPCSSSLYFVCEYKDTEDTKEILDDHDWRMGKN